MWQSGNPKTVAGGTSESQKSQVWGNTLLVLRIAWRSTAGTQSGVPAQPPEMWLEALRLAQLNPSPPALGDTAMQRGRVKRLGFRVYMENHALAAKPVGRQQH